MRTPDTLLRAVREVLASAFGPDLDGSERGERVSRFYLARIRDVVFEYLPGAPAPGGPCEDCADLRNRLRNIYHLTLTHQDPAEAIRGVREASAPGAPRPAPLEYSGTVTEHGRCGVDCLACAAGGANA
jgi:hypothetical protein